MRIDDVDLLVELDSDPDVMRFLTGRPSTRTEVEAFIRRNLGHRWIAVDRTSGEFVGWFGLVPCDDDTFEIGYRLGRQWWGRGLATEGARAIIDGAFTVLGARRVTAQSMAVNQRSRRVMERCGMRYLRTFHVEFDDPLPGIEHGETEYELTADEWQRRNPDRHLPSESCPDAAEPNPGYYPRTAVSLLTSSDWRVAFSRCSEATGHDEALRLASP
jgi:RimJ/RimL family protein N-acetyltransferase